MEHVSLLIKPASALCNMKCKYCFYANISSLREVQSYGKMRPQVTEKMIENVYKELNDGDQLTLAFQGGEPTVAGLRYFKHLTETVERQDKKVAVHYSIQTNGTLIDEEWCAFLKAYDFLVGLSIDGHQERHDANRLSHKNEATFERILHTKELFDQYGIEYNMMCVVTEQLANEADQVFDFMKENEIQYIQFIPCLDDLDAKERSEFALTPYGFARFYKDLLRLWMQELRNGHYISIKLFDDIINLLVNRQVTACGMIGNCAMQYVIEADGSVFPCDFYCLDEYKVGNITEHTLRELMNSERTFEFLHQPKELSSFCLSCPFRKMCNGGCMRMTDAMYVAETEDYCGYQSLLKEFIPNIDEALGSLVKIQNEESKI